MSDIYDDGATYGPDPSAQINEPSADPIYDDGARYGADPDRAHREVRTPTVTMTIQPDLSDRNRCIATHWNLPVQCVLPPTHRDDHEAWHPESGNRIRFCGESVRPYTEELYHGQWTRLYAPEQAKQG